MGRKQLSYLGDVAEAEQWLTDWQARTTQNAERARELAVRMTGITASARSIDGAVRVKVDSGGVPLDITLDAALEGWPAQRIAAQIMAVMRQAHADLTNRVEEAAAETVGAEGHGQP